MHENETELVSAQKNPHPKGIQFSEEKLLVSLASFIQESGWEFFRELATSIGGHSVFFFPKPLGSRMTLTIKVPGRRHTVGPYYKNPLKDEVDLIILLHATVCKILSTQESGIDVAPRTFCKNIKCSL